MNQLEATIDSLNTRWHTALVDIKDITHIESRDSHIKYMTEIWDEASFLHSQYAEMVHPIILGKLLHIISSPVPSHIIKTIPLCKNNV